MLLSPSLRSQSAFCINPNTITATVAFEQAKAVHHAINNSIRSTFMIWNSLRHTDMRGVVDLVVVYILQVMCFATKMLIIISLKLRPEVQKKNNRIF